ncbi:uncharacterized protein EAE98_011235 [Botrytis deweyae]|uniref:Uncharacterized protein n=1 Tax=Botrytis deweyae TaxID=2478750 RepID=A0ABQ7I6X0_9HELO|nr:uncharacterized protein EAE98_011235 [Botrytis deweyae]KAF7915369.1 hypothetical protein EAE98_011235 [Botrytis deweyae]
MRLSSFIKCLLVASVADRVSTTSALSPDKIALYLGVHADDANELMNTNDYLFATFNQSAGTVAAWSPVTKESVYSVMQELLNLENISEKRLNPAQSSGDAQVSSKEAVIKIKLNVAEVADKASVYRKSLVCSVLLRPWQLQLVRFRHVQAQLILQ